MGQNATWKDRGVERISVVNDHELLAIVRRCYSDVDVRDRTGNVARGFTNLKRIFGWPAELQSVVEHSRAPSAQRARGRFCG
jgi:hypothetical protein